MIASTNHLAGTSYSVTAVGARVHVDRGTSVRCPHQATLAPHRGDIQAFGVPLGERHVVSSFSGLSEGRTSLRSVRFSTVTVQTNIPSLSVHPIGTPVMPALACCTLAGEDQAAPCVNT